MLRQGGNFPPRIHLIKTLEFVRSVGNFSIFLNHFLFLIKTSKPTNLNILRQCEILHHNEDFLNSLKLIILRN